MAKKHRSSARPDLRGAAAGARGGEPFSRPFVVDRLRADAFADITITADEDERAALAEIDGLDRVDRLEGRFRLTRRGAGVQVTGEVQAEVVRTCVVSLEPFPALVSEPVEVRFAPEAEVAEFDAASAHNSGEPFEDVADAADIPDAIVDGRIDLGALAAEFLALGLDPHPRKPGVSFEPSAVGPASDSVNVSPFAALRARSEKT